MRFVGLPGEAALAVVTGMFLNFYAAIGIIIALGLTAWLWKPFCILSKSRI